MTSVGYILSPLEPKYDITITYYYLQYDFFVKYILYLSQKIIGYIFPKNCNRAQECELSIHGVFDTKPITIIQAVGECRYIFEVNKALWHIFLLKGGIKISKIIQRLQSVFWQVCGIRKNGLPLC